MPKQTAVSLAIFLLLALPMGGQAVLVTGGGGGPTIPLGVVQSIVNAVDFGMDVAHALDAARLQEPTCCAMKLEKGRVLRAVRNDLTSRGHVLADNVGEYDSLPSIQAVGTDLRTGEHVGASDPRGQQGTLGQP